MAMSQPKIILRALPNVEFVHGYPGIPASQDRHQAAIRGSLELRLGQQPIKAKWVKVELRKIETIPSHGNRNDDFIDIIGKSPVTLWQAQADNEFLTSRDMPFTLAIPETIPSSVALRNGLGIRYEVMATLSMKGKKGLFRRDASKSVSNCVAVVIDKHELHSTWPIYTQPESRHMPREDGLVLVVDRGNTCFGPGDRIVVVATLKSDNLTPVVVRGFEFYLVEVITFIAGHQSHGKHKGGSNTGPIVTVLGEHKIPLSLTLYGGTQHKAELGCVVPPGHTTSSISTARHIDVTYKLRIKIVLDLISPFEAELPVTLTNWPRSVSAEIVRRIGPAPNLSPKVITTARPGQAISAVTHTNLGPPLPPPTGALPSIPDAPPPVPAKNDIIGRAGASILPSSVPPNGVASSQKTGEYSKVAAEPSRKAGTILDGADELGYVTMVNGNHAATAPARVTRVSSQRNTATEGEPFSESDHQGLSSSGSIGRRTRGMSRLKVMNASDDIPEEESPIQHEGPSASGNQTRANGNRDRADSLPGSARNKWLTAEQEKKKLYDEAKAKVDAHGRTRSQERATDSGFGTAHANLSTTSVEKSRPTTANTTTTTKSKSKSGWLTAEEEKRKLFDEAQKKVRQTQGLGPMSPISPTFSTTPPQPNGSLVSSTTPPLVSDAYSSSSYNGQSGLPLSRGAALYSQAMNSLTRANSATTSTQSPSAGQPRRNASAQASAARPGTAPTSQRTPNIPQEDPISYEELFGNHSYAVSSSNEKDRLRQKYDAEESATRSVAPHPPSAPQQPLSEKEIMRRAFEARDAALLAAGQTPPPMIFPSSSSTFRPPSAIAPNASSLPPGYDTSGSLQDNRHLTAAEEKAQLADQYGTMASPGTTRSMSPSTDLGTANVTREKSMKSDVSEGFLRRDPSISAGKRRASQIQQPITAPPPPPLPPRPPQEYIEETREQDRRTTLLSSFPLQISSSIYDDAGYPRSIDESPLSGGSHPSMK